jgi:hypothetical protein
MQAHVNITYGGEMIVSEKIKTKVTPKTLKYSLTP